VPRQALEKAAQAGEFLVSPEIADEYFEVFSRSKFDKYVSLEMRMAFLSEIRVMLLS
jgi:predicted nucleic acid-binding protein